MQLARMAAAMLPLFDAPSAAMAAARRCGFLLSRAMETACLSSVWSISFLSVRTHSQVSMGSLFLARSLVMGATHSSLLKLRAMISAIV